MTRTATRVMTLLVGLALLTGLGLGQQVVPGTPPFGSFGGGPFDTVNLGNLNAHFAVPILSKAGRGIPFTYNLAYDTSVWYPVFVSGSETWQMVPNAGWTVETQATTGYVSYTSTSGSAPCDPPSIPNLWYYTIYSNWTYHDSFGLTHSFPGLSDSTGSGGCPNLSWLPPTTASKSASDGSGYTLSADQGFLAQLTSRSGGLITPPINVNSGTGTATDANGNQISVNSSGVFTDTLGTTALQVTGSPNSSPMVFTYTGPSGSVEVKVNYSPYNLKTNFGCSGISEYTATGVYLVSGISLPDGSAYSFTYEQNGTYYTGRLHEVTLPTGGTITYTYSGSNGGVSCADGSTIGLTRALSPGGTWPYTRSQVSGSHWTTKVTSPLGDDTVSDFEQDSATISTNNFYETQRLSYQGSSSSGTLLSTAITCYNGNGVSSPSSCPATGVATPILRTTAFNSLPNSSGVEAETDSTYDIFGLIHDVYNYDFGNGAVGSLLRHTATTYVGGMSNGIVDRPYQVTIYNTSGTMQAQTTYTYDAGTPTATSSTPQHVAITGSRGNVTTVAAQASSSGTTLYRQFTYYDTGMLSTSTDVSTSSTTNGATTTYTYGSGTSCGNSFVTSISEPLSLTRSMTWNCNGSVLTQLSDENSQPASAILYRSVFLASPQHHGPGGQQHDLQLSESKSSRE